MNSSERMLKVAGHRLARDIVNSFGRASPTQRPIRQKWSPNSDIDGRADEEVSGRLPLQFTGS
jgi:hypothetical protein